MRANINRIPSKGLCANGNSLCSRSISYFLFCNSMLFIFIIPGQYWRNRSSAYFNYTRLIGTKRRNTKRIFICNQSCIIAQIKLWTIGCPNNIWCAIFCNNTFCFSNLNTFIKSLLTCYSVLTIKPSKSFFNLSD